MVLQVRKDCKILVSMEGHLAAEVWAWHPGCYTCTSVPHDATDMTAKRHPCDRLSSSWRGNGTWGCATCAAARAPAAADGAAGFKHPQRYCLTGDLSYACIEALYDAQMLACRPVRVQVLTRCHHIRARSMTLGCTPQSSNFSMP